MQGGGESPGDAAFGLAFEAERVDDASAIESADDAVDADVAGRFADGDFGDLRDEAVVGIDVAGEAASPVAVGQRSWLAAPVGFLGHEFEGGDEASAIDLRVAKFQDVTGLQEFEAQVERVASGGVRHLVDERLAREDLRGILDSAPRTGGHGRVAANEVGLEVGEVVGIVERAPGAAVVVIVARVGEVFFAGESEHGKIAADGALVPGEWFAGGVEGAGDANDAGRLEESEAHVVAARPHNLHRLADGLGNFDGFGNVVDEEAASEGSAGEGGVDG